MEPCVLAIGQNRPSTIEIKGLKTGHFKESKTVPWDPVEIGSMGQVDVLKVSLQITKYGLLDSG